MRINRILLICLYIILAIFILLPVFLFTPIAGGDYINVTKQQLVIWQRNSFFIWDRDINLGWSIIPLLSYAPYSFVMGWVGSILGNSGIIAERLGWWLPFLIIGFISSLTLTKYVLKQSVFSWLAPLIFLFNTYILILLSGGQIAGIGLAYAFIPFVLLSYIKLLEQQTFKNAVITGIILSIAVMFDVRMTYVGLVGIGLYLLVKIIFSLKRSHFNTKTILSSLLFIVLIPGLVTFLLHAFWLIPLAFVRQNPLTQFGDGYTTTNAVTFFSFAKFEDALGLLHPNWPENIFGKTYFMRPEYLILPLLAFSSLLFIQKKKNEKNLSEEGQHIFYFILLGLLGIFLAKGANDPFGFIYLWLFSHVPGFIMFRDPTKFYLLIAIAYSILIPFSVWKIYNWLQQKKIRYMQHIFVAIVILALLFLIRPALFRQLGGTFQVHIVPAEYIRLENALSDDTSFSRILWVPSVERYAVFSQNHPVVYATDLLHVASLSAVLQQLKKPDTEQKLQERSIKYLILPYDTQKEIFIIDRKYDPKLQKNALQTLRNVSWLTELPGFGNIHVFSLNQAKDHFWVVNDKDITINYRETSPTDFALTINNAKRGDRIIFTDAYDKHWQLTAANHIIGSRPFENSLNSFVLPDDGNYNAKVSYQPQELVCVGILISGLTMILLIGYFLIGRRKR